MASFCCCLCSGGASVYTTGPVDCVFGMLIITVFMYIYQTSLIPIPTSTPLYCSPVYAEIHTMRFVAREAE